MPPGGAATSLAHTLHWMYTVNSCPALSRVVICIMCGCWKALWSTRSTAQIRRTGMDVRTCAWDTKPKHTPWPGQPRQTRISALQTARPVPISLQTDLATAFLSLSVSFLVCCFRFASPLGQRPARNAAIENTPQSASFCRTGSSLGQGVE